MPIDWDAFERGIDEDLDRAAARTDARLASRISSVTRLTDEEVLELFPEPADVERLKRLLRIVHSAEEENMKKADLARNVEDLGGVVLTLLRRVI